MTRPQSSISRHISQFCGALGHIFRASGRTVKITARHSTTHLWTNELWKFITTQQEAPIRVINLNTEVLNWNPQCIFYKRSNLDGVNLRVLPLYCLNITGLKNCCFLFRGSLHFPLLPTSYSKGLRISSGVYWSRLTIFASFLYSIFKNSFISLLKCFLTE